MDNTSGFGPLNGGSNPPELVEDSNKNYKMTKLWTCGKCKRKFEKENQSHSCVIYDIKNHFKNKEKGKELYDELIEILKKEFKFTIDSVPCCIHLVKINTFLGIFILKDRIRLTIALPYEIKSKIIRQYAHVSKNRYHYQIEIKDKKDINKELLGWIREACGK